jgi:LTXXQ motif family protein
MQERMEQRATQMQERMNRRVERLKADLKLTPAQEPLFATVQSQLTKMQQERRSLQQGAMPRMRNAELPDRLDMMSERAARGATNLRELSTAVKPLWATLSDTQKETVRKAMPGSGRWQDGEGRRDGRRGEMRGHDGDDERGHGNGHGPGHGRGDGQGRGHGEFRRG